MACNCNPNLNSTSYLQVVAPCPSCHCTCTTPTQTCGYCTSSGGTCSPCGEDTIDSSKIIYSGPALPCIDLPTDTPVEEILQAMDTAICQATGADYSAYDFACLLNPDDSQITTQQQFVEAISEYVCNLEVTHDTFVTEYNTFVTEITNLVTVSSVPGITTDCTGILITDTNAQAFVKLDAAICDIQEAINPSGADWESCGFTVGSEPQTITEGFAKILEYLCLVADGVPDAVTLPTFNNVGTCLPGTLTATDTLSSTVEKLKTKICELDYSLGALNFGCVDGGSALEDVIQNILDRVNEYSIYEFDPDYFIVENINDLFPCNGKTVSIDPTGLDYKVASNGADITPGTLEDKLEEGDGIDLDYTTTPGKVIITCDFEGDHKVMVNASDVAPDYLDTKIDGAADSTGAITLAADSNVGNDTVIITPTIDYAALMLEGLLEVQTNVTLLSLLRSIICEIDCESDSTVQFAIEAASKSLEFTADQNTPTLAWYNTGAVVVSGLLTSGTFPITTVAVNPQATFTFTNNELSSVDVDIVVKDLSNVSVPSSSVISTTVSAGATYTNAAVNLGIGVSAYVVHVTVS